MRSNIPFYFGIKLFCLLLALTKSDDTTVLEQTSGFIESNSSNRVHDERKSPLKWQVMVPKNKVIEIKFEKFHVGQLKKCDGCKGCNKMKIWDKSKMIGGESYCATNKPPNFRSLSNNLTIELFEDEKLQPSAFKIVWEQKDKCDPNTEFECWNGKCLKKSLKCNQKNDCGDESDEIECDHHNEACGKNLITPSFTWYNRIVGGQPAKEGSWPWIAMLVKSSQQFCGASIISENWLITAAHCVASVNRRVSAYVGRYHRSGDVKTEQELTVNKFIIHPDFDEKTLNNDIALIQVNEKINFNDYVQPICILPPNEVNVEKDLCVAAGWGTLKHETKTRPNKLYQVRLPLVKPKTCRKLYRHYFSDDFPRDYHVCAGQAGRDTCQGDSGGPLMCFIDERKWTLTGISSFGFGCGSTLPGVYTDTTYYYRWIKTESSSSWRNSPSFYTNLAVFILISLHVLTC